MILYIETNFVLELALSQEQSAACRGLLELAKANPGRLELAIPSFCAGETYEAWARKRQRSEDTHGRLLEEASQLARSAAYRARSKTIRRMANSLALALDEQERNLDDVLKEILGTARVIPLDPTTHADALKLRRSRGFRRMQDALVYASVLVDLTPRATPAAAMRRLSGPHVFTTRDRRDFLDPDVRRDVRSLDCDLVSDFSHALARVRSHLR